MMRIGISRLRLGKIPVLGQRRVISLNVRKIITRTVTCGAAVAAIGLGMAPAASAAPSYLPVQPALSFGSVTVPICLVLPVPAPVTAAICI